jgi:hypothetical protein
MKTLIPSLVLITISFVGRSPAFAAVSPHETISATIDDDKITIVYGRPYTKNPRTGEVRKIWGGLVPYGKVWRTGADAATILTTEKDLVIGDTTVPAGKYSLYTYLAEDGSAKLIINKKTGQWGIPYPAETEKEELARVDMKKEAIDHTVDQFTMAVESNPSGGGVIKMSWEKTQYSVPFTVKK